MYLLTLYLYTRQAAQNCRCPVNQKNGLPLLTDRIKKTPAPCYRYGHLFRGSLVYAILIFILFRQLRLNGS